MYSMDHLQILLDQIAEEVPAPFFKYLNGGILLLDEIKRHPNALADDLYILGSYNTDPLLGRFIIIYGGSFNLMYGEKTEQEMTSQLRHTLLHEFTHHLESLSGQRDLEIQDEKFMREYLIRHGVI